MSVHLPYAQGSPLVAQPATVRSQPRHAPGLSSIWDLNCREIPHSDPSWRWIACREQHVMSLFQFCLLAEQMELGEKSAVNSFQLPGEAGRAPLPLVR